MAHDRLATLRNEDVADLTEPVLLYDAPGHRVYWVGSVEESHFRCNAYLLVTERERVLIDPGGVDHFPQVRDRVTRVADPRAVTHILVHHQDPDLCASIPLWLKENPAAVVLTHSRARVLLPHYGFQATFQETDEGSLTLAGGHRLEFVQAPFLHFPGAFATYDTASRYLFTGDVFAALSGDWRLVVDDLETHLGFMELFHVDYMASNRAARGFLANLGSRPVAALLPQHGSIIRGEDVPRALQWLEDLPCGLDLLYPEA